MDKTLLELIDGAYELVELYKPESPAQEAWKRNWLEKAIRAGAGPGWYRRTKNGGEEMIPNELQKAQWWLVGWRRAYYQSGSGLVVTNRANTADHRLYLAIRQHEKEATK